MGYKVFLSHNSADAIWVKWIAENCNAVGISAYLYEHDRKPGQMLADKLQAAIRDCDTLVVLLTENSQFSPYVQQEIGSARALSKPIIPLAQPGIDNRSLAMLQGVESISFDFHNARLGLSQLLQHLQNAKLAKERSQGLFALGALIVAALALGR